MRRLSVLIAVVAVLGWAASANAGSVTKQYQVSVAYGASGSASAGGITIGVDSVMGTLTGKISTPSSTWDGESVPPSSASMHMAGGTITATAMVTGFGWTFQGTVWAAPVGSTQCHVGASGKVAGSCSASFDVTTKAHCTGNRCDAYFVPGCFASPYASVTHTQMWLAKSVHLGAATFSHTANSAHYLKSFQAKLTPPTDSMTCDGGTAPHLASSDSGFHTFHIGAKEL